MNTMKFGTITCSYALEKDFVLDDRVSCRFLEETPEGRPFSVPCGRDAVIYAVERFIPRCEAIRRECCYDSWHIRLAKGKARRPKRFSFLVPGSELGLPCPWVRLCGETDAAGMTVRRVELLAAPPKPRKN